MIYINNFTIAQDFTSISVDVETDSGNTFTSASFWTDTTFKDPIEAIDLTSKLSQTGNEESFIILPEDVGLTSFENGIFFIEFESTSTSSNCDACENPLGVASSLLYLNECLLNKVLGLCNCGGFNSSLCDEDMFDEIINIHMLIDAMKVSLEFGYYNEAIDIFKALNKLCGDSNCESCGDFNSFTTNSGLNYGMLDNNLMLL